MLITPEIIIICFTKYTSFISYFIGNFYNISRQNMNDIVVNTAFFSQYYSLFKNSLVKSAALALALPT